MIVSEQDDICENIASFSIKICDKCNGNGFVRYFQTISTSQVSFVYTFFYTFYNATGFSEWWKLARNVLYKRVTCDKCNGKHNIYVYNQNKIESNENTTNIHNL